MRRQSRLWPSSGGLRLRDAHRPIVIRESSINPVDSSYDDMTKSVPRSHLGAFLRWALERRLSGSTHRGASEIVRESGKNAPRLVLPSFIAPESESGCVRGASVHRETQPRCDRAGRKLRNRSAGAKMYLERYIERSARAFSYLQRYINRSAAAFSNRIWSPDATWRISK